MDCRQLILNETVEHFLTDETGVRCGDFTFNDTDLSLHAEKQLNMNDQPSQMIVTHPKIPGLSWMVFFYQTGQNQYQPKIAYDFPSYLRADTELCIRFGGMHWIIKAKFQGSGWLTKQVPPKVMNERWTTLGMVVKCEVNVRMSKIWFKFPLFSACCHAINSQRCSQQPNFLTPDAFSDCQLVPSDYAGRRLFVHKQILALNSSCLAERLARIGDLNNQAAGPTIPVPFSFEVMLDFLKMIYPNSQFIITEQNVEGLMDVAREYHVFNVIREAEKFLFKNLEAGSAILSYHLACKHQLPLLKEAALLHISEMNATQVRSRVNMDLKGKSPDIQEALLNELSSNLAECHL